MRDPVPQLKAQLGAVLAERVEGWRRVDIAMQIGADSAVVSRLRHQNLERFSLETLIRFAARLGFEVALSVQRRRINGGRRTLSRGVSNVDGTPAGTIARPR